MLNIKIYDMKFRVIVDLRVEQREFVVSEENLFAFIRAYHTATLVFRELPIEFNPNALQDVNREEK